MSSLVLLPPAPVIDLPDGRVVLDRKFIEGMRAHAAHWPGPVHCVMRRSSGEIPFAAQAQARATLGFDLHVLDAADPLPQVVLENAALVLCSGDMVADLDLWRLRGQGLGAKLVYTVEYTLGGRIATAWLDQDRARLRRLMSMRWILAQEPRRRRAFRGADALQVNGYPAWQSYAALNSDTLMYLDNRMSAGLFATPDDMAARAAHLRSGGVLRLIHSGRLEPMKGAQDLVPVARALRARGVAFSLDIYGTGTLETAIGQAVASEGLGDRVRLHGAVDFADALVPATRQGADLFLSCHRQPDPSCTYIEAMGCGVPVAGYQNRMWRELCQDSGGGWAVPLGRTEVLARVIADLAATPERLIEAADRALTFARANAFESVFAGRMAHLRAVAGL